MHRQKHTSHEFHIEVDQKSSDWYIWVVTFPALGSRGPVSSIYCHLPHYLWHIIINAIESVVNLFTVCILTVVLSPTVLIASALEK